MGPVVSREQMETVAAYVRKGLEDHATLVGGRASADGEP
jgi:acyl-CoA reductase-like NAD-dependent aldehyde dehydrogenase